MPPEFFGPMWPDGEPDGWPKAEEVDSNAETAEPYEELEPLGILIDPGDASAEELGELFYEISELYRMMGGSGIDFRVSEVREGVVDYA